MGKAWELFENMNEVIYVADVDTYDIIYMNRKARQLRGIGCLEELRGKKCYEVMDGNAEPCSVCYHGELEVGQFEEWKYFDSDHGKPFMLKETVVEEDGRRYRFRMFIDLTSPDAQDVQEAPSKLIWSHINAEKIINDALRVSLRCSDAEQSIQRLMEHVGSALDCDRIYIFELTEGNTFSNTYEWCAQGVVPQIDNLQKLAMRDFETWMGYFVNNQNVLIEDLEATREHDPAMYDILKPQDIHSLVVSPMIVDDRVLGFYGVDNPPGHLLQSISTLFMILGHFILSLLKRRDMNLQLVRLGLYDELTRLGNRHLLDQFVASMDPKGSLGVVNCDVTGLKRLNDTQGHQAGDALLIRAAGCLRSAFPNNVQFRVGGDEFLVLCPGISQAALEERVEYLRLLMDERSALMAVGAAWSPRAGDTLQALMAQADERMYEDKRKQYAKMSPEEM
jgi:diguanylate cyclase (GGDEF)-like protein